MQRKGNNMMTTELISALKNDPELYYAWQANIAVQFQDEFAKNIKFYKNKKDIHEISNNAAKNFLDLLISNAKKG